MSDIGKRITTVVQKKVEALEKERAEFNFRSIQPYIPLGSRVLDVGAWKCYLGELLKERCRCDALSVDVVNVNATSMPFLLFDGRTFPVKSESIDVVLLLYVLHHASDDEILMREARRVLAKEGRVLIAEDMVDGLWNKIRTYGLHLWLKCVAGLGWDGCFRKIPEWQVRFWNLGFEAEWTVHLGHHLGRRLWPSNVLFVLRERPLNG